MWIREGGLCLFAIYRVQRVAVEEVFQVGKDEFLMLLFVLYAE